MMGIAPPFVLLTVACIEQASLALHWSSALTRWYNADTTVAHELYAISSSPLSYHSISASSSDCRNSSQLLLDQRSFPFERRRATCGQERGFFSSSAVHFLSAVLGANPKGPGYDFINEQSLVALFLKSVVGELIKRDPSLRK
jgi:hypothetical protein